MFGDRFIMVHFKDPNSNLKLNPFLTGTTVTGKQDPYAFDKVPDTAELQEKLDEFEKYDNRGLRELVRKIEVNRQENQQKGAVISENINSEFKILEERIHCAQSFGKQCKCCPNW